MSRRELGAIATALLALALICAPAAAQDDEAEAGQRLDEIEEAITAARRVREALGVEAAAIAGQLDGLRETMLAAEEAMREHEQALLEIEDTLAALREELAQRRDAFDARRDELALVLAALQRIARQPAEMLMAMPRSPTDTHRTAMLLAALTPELDRRAKAIAAELRALAAIEEEILAQEQAQSLALEELVMHRSLAGAALARKHELLSGLEREDEELALRQAELSREAGSLRELLDELARQAAREKERAAEMAAAVDALAATSFSAARGNLALPASGTITAHFGDSLDDGTASEGLVIATQAGARVVTPYDGQVVYSGPFRDYGHLLIIEHGEGYHTVLAGFARAEVVLGQWLLAGEPVGAMSSDDADNRRLYVELRRNGDPINPLPWMAAGSNEVSGG